MRLKAACFLIFFPLMGTGYNYCGNDSVSIYNHPINKLDEQCRKHKIVYMLYPNDLKEQMEADRRLVWQAWDRVFATDSSNSEIFVAWLVMSGVETKNGSNTIKNHGIFKREVQVHIPSYKFCGPGTDISQLIKLSTEELRRLGVNKLDQYCLWHDMVYGQNPNVEKIIEADIDLADSAVRLITESDSSIGEKASAFVVAACMVFKQPYNYVRSWFS